jgi:hypothetical protein
MFGKNIIESYANGFLDKGYKLPLPQNITRFIKNQKVVPKEGYLLVDGDADFTQKETPSVKRILQQNARRSGANPMRQQPNLTVNEAEERFYQLVQDVYLLKLQNGNFDR